MHVASLSGTRDCRIDTTLWRLNHPGPPCDLTEQCIDGVLRRRPGVAARCECNYDVFLGHCQAQVPDNVPKTHHNEQALPANRTPMYKAELRAKQVRHAATT